MKGKKTYAILAAAALLLAALACNPPGRAIPTLVPTSGQQIGGTDPTATPTPTPPSPLTTSTPDTTSPPAATDTPVPDISGEGECTLNAAWVADVTVPDNTVFSPGAAFIKTWRVRNSGTCDWETGTKLVHVSGDPLGGPAEVTIGAVAAGSNTDVSVNMSAPTAPGTYKSNWQPQAPDGTRFGSVIYAQIVVPAPATDTPEPTDTPTPTETQSPGTCVAPNATLKPILDQAEGMGYDMGCPTAPASTIQGAFQEFWTNIDEINPHLHYRSLMIWRSDNKEIYVIDGKNTDASEGMLYAYTDSWEEGQPHIHPDCAGMTVPSGYQLPVRGFGKVWCVNDLVDEVGWPSWNEEQATLLVQPMQTGLLLKVSNTTFTSYLVALDYQAVYAVTLMTSP